jgi:hypothetical protein
MSLNKDILNLSNFEIYNQETAFNKKEYKATISCSINAGRFTLNGTAVELLDVEVGSGITLIRDKVTKDWYIYKDIKGLILKKSNKIHGKYLTFLSVNLVKRFLNDIEPGEEKTIKFAIGNNFSEAFTGPTGENLVKLYPIMTSAYRK